jgi:fatty acid amide hydrolase
MDRARLDALICPPYAVPAIHHGAGDQLHVASAGSYASLVNVLGYPSGVVAATRVRPGEETAQRRTRDLVERAAARAEAGSEGLPVGVQVIARPWREDIVLAVMRLLEGAFRARPGYPKTPVDPTIRDQRIA